MPDWTPPPPDATRRRRTPSPTTTSAPPTCGRTRGCPAGRAIDESSCGRPRRWIGLPPGRRSRRTVTGPAGRHRRCAVTSRAGSGTARDTRRGSRMPTQEVGEHGSQPNRRDGGGRGPGSLGSDLRFSLVGTGGRKAPSDPWVRTPLAPPDPDGPIPVPTRSAARSTIRVPPAPGRAESGRPGRRPAPRA